MAYIKNLAASFALLLSAAAVPQTAFAGDCELKTKVKRTVEYCAKRGLVPGTVYGCVEPKTKKQAVCRTKVQVRYVPEPVSYGLQCDYGMPYRDYDGKYVCPTARPVAPVYTAPAASYALPDTVVEAPAQKSWFDVPLAGNTRGLQIASPQWSSVDRYRSTTNLVGDVTKAGATWLGAREIGRGIAQSGSTQVVNNNNGQPGTPPGPVHPDPLPDGPGTPNVCPTTGLPGPCSTPTPTTPMPNPLPDGPGLPTLCPNGTPAPCSGSIPVPVVDPTPTPSPWTPIDGGNGLPTG